MYTISWKLQGIKDNKEIIKGGENSFDSTLIISSSFENTTIKEVVGDIKLDLKDEDRTWINGYQTWTYTKECDKKAKQRGLNYLPHFADNYYSLNRYGDYNFVEYPYKKGITQGWSWMTIRRGDEYTLIASLSEKEGYTFFSLDRNKNVLRVERDSKGLVVNGEYNLFSLFVFTGTENEVYASWFEKLGLKKKDNKALAGYSSWYNHFQDINQNTIKEDLDGCKKILEKGDLFQIDDGWEIKVGDWYEDEKKFPLGLKKEADKIKDAGYIPGLWLAPFVAEKDSELFKNHQDWFLKGDDGEPYKSGCGWSGYYALDIDKEEVLDYLRRIFKKVYYEWGFKLVKLDFIYAVAPFNSKTETRAKRMERAIDFLREVSGENLILACGAPLFPIFGKADYSRISSDVSLDWDDKFYMKAAHLERVSSKHALETSHYRRQLNNGAFIVDPDVFFLRDNNIKLTKEQKVLLATATALNKGLFLTSDNPSLYTEEMTEEYKRIRHIWEKAENIRVTHNNERVIHYTLDGKEESLTLPF